MRGYILLLSVSWYVHYVTSEGLNTGSSGGILTSIMNMLGLNYNSFSTKKMTNNTMDVDSEVQQLASISPQVDEGIVLSEESIGRQIPQDNMASLIEILENTPNDIIANRALGSLLLQKNNPALAERFLLNAAVLSEWTDLIAMLNLAQVESLLGKIDLAERAAMKGLELSKDSSPAFVASFSYVLGVICEEKKDYMSASDWYLASVLVEPNNIDTWLLASTLNFPTEAVNLQMAENILLEAYSRHPNNAVILHSLGTVMQRTSRNDKAITLLEASLTIDDKNNNALSALAFAYYAEGLLEKSYSTYQECYKRSPGDITVLLNFAGLLFEQQKFDECEFALKLALEMNPQLEPALHLLTTLNVAKASAH
jgi:tetratricopeptide (TPR) repeat protein